MRLTIDGQTVPVKTLDTAPLSAVAELQQQTGWTLPVVRENSAKVDAFRISILVFLSLRAAKIPATWDSVTELSSNDVIVTSEPGDAPRSQEEELADPQEASGDSSQDADAPPAE